jgi:hypothetical protein
VHHGGARGAPLSQSASELPIILSTMVKETKESPCSLSGVFLSLDAYRQVSSEFHPYHQHELNVFAHLFTTGLGVWGAIQLLKLYGLDYAIVAYAFIIALTTPFWTSIVHTAIVVSMSLVPVLQVDAMPLDMDSRYVCLLAIVLGYSLQDLAHYVFQEKTYMNAYIYTRPLMLFVHTLWLLPLVIDSVLMRWCFLPNMVSRNRTFFTQASSQKSIADLREWIDENVKEVKETTHLWPHENEATSVAVKALEDDAAIYAAFRTVFAAKHYDVKPGKLEEPHFGLHTWPFVVLLCSH